MTTTIVWTFPTFVVADDELSLDTGDAYECQINSASLDPTVTFATIPSTGCTGPQQSPSAAAWALSLAWLQDWTDPGGGLSGWALTNALTQKWFRLLPDKNDTTVSATGQIWVVPGSFGGTFGDGSAGAATAVWQVIGTPDFAMPAPLP